MGGFDDLFKEMKVQGLRAALLIVLILFIVLASLVLRSCS
jgi:hypothetical protein